MHNNDQPNLSGHLAKPSVQSTHPVPVKYDAPHPQAEHHKSSLGDGVSRMLNRINAMSGHMPNNFIWSVLTAFTGVCIHSPRVASAFSAFMLCYVGYNCATTTGSVTGLIDACGNYATTGLIDASRNYEVKNLRGLLERCGIIAVGASTSYWMYTAVRSYFCRPTYYNDQHCADYSYEYKAFGSVFHNPFLPAIAEFTVGIACGIAKNFYDGINHMLEQTRERA